jgi:hypothetical protein
MKSMKKLTSEALRDICCAPENTDDPESIDFEDDEPEQTYSGEVKFIEVIKSLNERNDEDVFKN